jgi:hypothetical protein
MIIINEVSLSAEISSTEPTATLVCVGPVRRMSC